MKWFAFLLVPLLAGCATVAYNDGEKVALQHDHGWSIKDLTETAASACREAGKTGATYIMTTSKNPSLPSWMAKQISTFRCN